MSYIKWLLGAVFIVLCTFLGYKFSEKYRLRKKFYSGFYSFNKKMLDEMSFTRNSLLKVISDFHADETFLNVLYEYRDSLKCGGALGCEKLWYLSEEEKGEVCEFFSELGKTDAYTQVNFLKVYDAKLKDFEQKSAAEEKKFVSMYIKLGIFAGILALILIL